MDESNDDPNAFSSEYWVKKKYAVIESVEAHHWSSQFGTAEGLLKIRYKTPTTEQDPAVTSCFFPGKDLVGGKTTVSGQGSSRFHRNNDPGQLPTLHCRAPCEE